MAALGGALPGGERGRALAVGITLVAVCALWFGVISPIIDAYDSGEAAIVQRRALAQRMSDLADALPALRKLAASAAAHDTPSAAALEGATDAVAAASLQGLLETMANQAGAKVTSAEALPAEQAGAYRRIGLRVSLDANWATLVNLLRSIEVATPRMFVDDLQLHAQATGEKVRELPLDISLTLLAFRLPGAPAATGAAPPAATDGDGSPAPEVSPGAGPGAAPGAVPGVAAGPGAAAGVATGGADSAGAPP